MTPRILVLLALLVAGSLTACDSNDAESQCLSVVYGDDNAERLDQLATGAYTSEIRFVDETNDRTVTRAVNLTVQ